MDTGCVLCFMCRLDELGRQIVKLIYVLYWLYPMLSSIWF
jgi:hypothetical protein